MTTLAIGSSITIAVRDGGTITISTNGGFGSAVVTLTEGGTSTVSFGPAAERRVLGPYKEGASVVLTNSSSGAFDYDAETQFDPSNVAIKGGSIGANVTDRANTIVLFGDSITNYNGGPGSAAGGGDANWDSKGWFVWGNNLLGGRFRCVKNAGIAGDQTSQMLARISTDVLAYTAGWVTVLGGTNDVGTGVSAATIQANLQSIYTQILQSGSRVIAIPILPRNSLTAAQYNTMAAVNRWIRDTVRATAGMYLADIGAAVYDTATTYGVQTGMTVDGTHPNSPGAAAMGKLFALAVSGFAPTNDVLFVGSGSDNLLTGPHFVGTGTTIATGWSLQGGTGATFSYVNRTDGLAGKWMQAAVANAGSALITQNVSVGASLAIGDQVYLAVETQCDTLDAAPAANTQNFQAYIQAYNGSSFTSKAYAAYWDSSYVNYPFPGSAGTFVTMPLILPVGTTLAQVVLQMGGGGNYRYGRAVLRKGAP